MSTYKFRFYRVCEYRGRKVLYNRVRWSVNRLFFLNAWGIDVGQFDTAVAQGIEGVLYEDVEQKRRYYLPLADVYRYGVRKSFRDNGEQIFVPVRFWEIESDFVEGGSRSGKCKRSGHR